MTLFSIFNLSCTWFKSILLNCCITCNYQIIKGMTVNVKLCLLL